MSLTAAELKILVNADTAGAERGLRNINERTREAGGGIKSFLGTVAGFATGTLIVQGAGAAFNYLKGNIGDMISSGMEANQVAAQLAAGLKSTHDASGMTMASLDKLSTSIMNQTGIDDDSVKASESMLLTFTDIGKNVFPQATQAVADLATKMANGAVPSAQQMEQASIQLGKALGNPLKGYTALQRVGVTFSDQQKEQIKHFMKIGDVAGAQNVILGEMNKEFGGSAAAAGQANGGMAILSASFDKMKESVGQAVIPILGKLMTSIEPLVQQFAQWLPGALKTTGDFISKNVMPVVSALADWFIKNGVPALQKFGDFITKEVIPTVRKLVEWFQVHMLPQITQFATFVETKVVPVLMKLAEWFGVHVLPVVRTLAEVFVNNVLPAVEKIWGSIARNLIPAVERLWEKLEPILIPTLRTLGWIFQNVLGPALQIGIDFFSKVVDAVSTVIDWIEKLFNAVSKVAGSIGGFFKNVGAGAHALHIPGFASGGTMPHSGLAMVGEAGPELVALPGGAQITPLASMSGGASSAVRAVSGGGPVHIHIHVAGQHVAEAILPDLTQAVRLGTGLRSW